MTTVDLPKHSPGPARSSSYPKSQRAALATAGVRPPRRQRVFGISPHADPVEVVLAVEHDPTTARLRGCGYLFGFPADAVDFFVAAADRQKETGVFVERDFISLPTVRGERHFVYAVPKGHTPGRADTALRAAVEPVFREYTRRRARHIHGDSATGVLDLVREWFDDGHGDVRPSHAKYGQDRRP